MHLSSARGAIDQPNPTPMHRTQVLLVVSVAAAGGRRYRNRRATAFFFPQQHQGQAIDRSTDRPIDPSGCSCLLKRNDGRPAALRVPGGGERVRACGRACRCLLMPPLRLPAVLVDSSCVVGVLSTRRVRASRSSMVNQRPPPLTPFIHTHTHTTRTTRPGRRSGSGSLQRPRRRPRCIPLCYCLHALHW